MPEELLRHSPLPERPVCPACRESLYPYGALVEKYGHLKWVEAWHCPVHGPVLPYDYAPEKSEPEKK